MTYIIEILICSGLFILLYRTLLEGRIPHRAARAYLVSSMLLAALMPAMDIPVYTAEPAAEHAVLEITAIMPETMKAENQIPETAQYGTGIIEDEVENEHKYTATFEKIAVGIYLLIFIINLALMMNRIMKIAALRRKSTVYRNDGYSLAISDDVADPFSFMNTIFMNGETRESGCRQIMIHELSHIRHRHTVERLIMELMRCFFWFNPFVWMAGQSLIEVQEWEADADVLDEGWDLNEYRTIIFSRLIGCNPDMTSGLHNKTTKKRFIMMTQNKRDKFSFIRLFAAAPLAAGMFLAFSCTTGRAENTQPETAETAAESSDTVAKIAFTPPAKGEIMHFFGTMTSLEGVTFPHNAIDIKVKTNDPIHAAADGTVTEISEGGTDYGKFIRIEHEQGYQSFYAHLNRLEVKEGDKVLMGQKIGAGGATGLVVIPHLRFSILKDGQYIDPMPLIHPHPTAEEILGKWFYHSSVIVRENKNLKA